MRPPAAPSLYLFALSLLSHSWLPAHRPPPPTARHPMLVELKSGETYNGQVRSNRAGRASKHAQQGRAAGPGTGPFVLPLDRFFNGGGAPGCETQRRPGQIGR